ncbi:MAG: hypothetical protein ACKVUT_00935 [Gaiella sp.]
MVELLSQASDAGAVDHLSRCAVSCENDLHAAITTFTSGEMSVDTVREFLDAAPDDGLLARALPFVAYGGPRSHRAVARAVAFQGRRALSAEESGGLGLRFAIVGRLTWALCAQAVASERLDFLTSMAAAHLPVRESSSPRPDVTRDKRLRYCAAATPQQSGNAQTTFEYYRDWLSSRSWLDQVAPYLAAGIDDAVAAADILLCLGAAQLGRPIYSAGLSVVASQGTGGPVGADKGAIENYLGIASVEGDALSELWERVEVSRDRLFDKPGVEWLLGSTVA